MVLIQTAGTQDYTKMVLPLHSRRMKHCTKRPTILRTGYDIGINMQTGREAKCSHGKREGISSK